MHKKNQVKTHQRGLSWLILPLLILLLSSVFLGLGRWALQWELQQRTTLTGPQSIDQLIKIELNGRQQHLYIRSQNPRLPLLLFLHGGPGFPAMPYTRELHPDLPRHFTLVHWDQRGAGKSFEAGQPHDKLQVQDFVQDTEALIDLLCARFQQQKVFLVGQSWGSIVGLKTALRNPDKLWAYIGIAQIIHPLNSWRSSLKRLRQRAQSELERGNPQGQQALKELEALSLEHYNAQDNALKRKWTHRFGGIVHQDISAKMAWLAFRSPEYSWWELGQLITGVQESGQALSSQIQTEINFFEGPHTLQTPVFFFQGRHDALVPAADSLKYYHLMQAPDKAYFWFEDSAHSPNKEEALTYQKRLIALKKRVMP